MATVNEEGFTAEELVQACNKVLVRLPYFRPYNFCGLWKLRL